MPTKTPTKTSQAGRELVSYYEGCVLSAYPDPKSGGDPWTIGYGHTGKEVKKGLKWTQAQANEALAEDLAEFEEIILDNVKVQLTQPEFDALVSIVFNVGPGGKAKAGIISLKDGSPSTLLLKLNKGDKAGAAAEFLKWVSPGSNVEKGLRRRRIAEKAHFEGKNWRAQ